MDFSWNDRRSRFCVLIASAGLFTISMAKCEATRSANIAIGLISVGISDKPLPSFLITTEHVATVSQKKWFESHKTPRYVLINMSLENIQVIRKSIIDEPIDNGKADYASGTYLVSDWKTDVKSQRLFQPKESKNLLEKIVKLVINKDQKEVIEQALHRDAQLTAPGPVPSD